MLTLVLTVDAASSESFTPTPDPMTSPRALHQATPLLDGRVLITGGIADLAAQGNVSTAEIFDPDPLVDPAFQEINTTCPDLNNPGCPLVARSFHRATLLPGGTLDGTVLITGGDSRGGGGSPFQSAEIFDPATGTFRPTTDLMDVVTEMKTPRSGHTATHIVDGRVLSTGGRSNSTTILSTAEIFDP